MSEDEAKAFLKKVGEDKELQEKLKGVDSEEKFFAVAKAAGFDFTKEEWLTVAPKQAEDPLREEDLGEVAGGKCQRGRPCWLVSLWHPGWSV
jgi:predicted ribosomally synthesized peptide with nif11-like leader